MHQTVSYLAAVSLDPLEQNKVSGHLGGPENGEGTGILVGCSLPIVDLEYHYGCSISL